MQTRKINKDSLISSAATVSGVAFGSMGSRVIAEKLPIENAKVKHGALAALALLGTAMVAGKDNAGKAVQGAFAGMAATQGVELIKEFVKPKDGILKTAMGTPNENAPIIIYDNSYAPPAIEVSHEEYFDNGNLYFETAPTQELRFAEV